MRIWQYLGCGDEVSRHTVRHVTVPLSFESSALVVDDEAAAGSELCSVLRTSFGVTHVDAARSSGEALRRVRHRRFDVVFTEIRIPGLDGIEMADVLRQFASPPAIVFVTAHDEYAVRAFEVGACDYVLKPVPRARLGVALGRALDRSPGRASPARPAEASATVPVEAGGRVRFVARDEVRWAEAHGDHVRLRMSDGETHMIRMTISRLEEMWADCGFIRIHRGYLVSFKYVSEFSAAGGNHTVTVAGHSLPVSRRHARDLRDRFLRAGWLA